MQLSKRAILCLRWLHHSAKRIFSSRRVACAMPCRSIKRRWVWRQNTAQNSTQRTIIWGWGCCITKWAKMNRPRIICKKHLNLAGKPPSWIGGIARVWRRRTSKNQKATCAVRWNCWTTHSVFTSARRSPTCARWKPCRLVFTSSKITWTKHRHGHTRAGFHCKINPTSWTSSGILPSPGSCSLKIRTTNIFRPCCKCWSLSWNRQRVKTACAAAWIFSSRKRWRFLQRIPPKPSLPLNKRWPWQNPKVICASLSMRANPWQSCCPSSRAVSYSNTQTEFWLHSLPLFILHHSAFSL